MKHYPNSVSKALALLTALVMTLSLAVTSAFAVSYQDMNPKDDALLGTKFPVTRPSPLSPMKTARTCPSPSPCPA